MWHKLYGAWNVACMEYKKLIRSTKMIILATDAGAAGNQCMDPCTFYE